MRSTSSPGVAADLSAEVEITVGKSVKDAVPGKRKPPTAKSSESARAASGREALEALDRMQAAAVSRLTGGLSPIALALAGFDWWMHLAASPGKRIALAEKASRKTARLGAQAALTA